MDKMKYLISLFLTIIFAMGQHPISVTGVIKDEMGNGLAYVNVYFMDTLEGAMSNKNGHFLIRTHTQGKRVLRISHIGFMEKDEILIVDTSSIHMNIVLEKSYMEMDPISVSAGSFTMADEEGQTLTSLDVVTTAGAAADIFRAVQTFPGVNQVDEGAGMYVRGGDVSETTVILDQATISHPYKYESDTGGYFGMIDPFLLSGTYFSTGGFSAKYGNILSGVMAMESLDMPSRSSITIGAGLAAISAGGSWVLKPDKLAIQFSGNYSNTTYLFKLNGGEERFDQVPTSWDGNVSTIWKYSPFGQIKIFHYSNVDEIGVNTESPTYNGLMLNDNHTQLSNMQLRHLTQNGIMIKSSLSKNQFGQGLTLGNIDKELDDHLLKWRTDISIPMENKMTWNAGFILDELKTSLSATFPKDPNDFSPEAETEHFNVDYESKHYGIYLENEYQWSQKIFMTIGLRTDILDQPKQQVWDPRLSLNYRLSDSQFLKIATGIYHQYPKAQYRDVWVGNPDLMAMSANHYILGYEYKSDLTDFKAELYKKDYSQLLLDDEQVNYSNEGEGYAYGADFFLKGTLPFISGWISYSYLQSKRKELDHLELVPTDYDINHNITAALKTQFNTLNNAGLTYRYTTGKPYTPSLNEWNSERLPAMQRLDLSYSRLIPIGTDGLLVLYLSVSNLLDKTNVYGYFYSPDYSERTELKSTHGRNIYFGFNLNL